MIQIVQMQEKDLEQVSKIEQDIFSNPWSKKSFSDSIKRNDTIYLAAKEEETVIGYCGIYCSFDEGEITNVAVRQEYRRLKIGQKLVEKLLEEAKTKGVTRFLLEVRESNKGAIALYQTLGFQIQGIRKGFYNKPKEDAFVMWKT